MLGVGQRGCRSPGVVPRHVEGWAQPGEHRLDDPITALAAEVERDRQERVEASAERLLQPMAGPVQARLHGLRPDRQGFGGLGDAHAFHRAQDEHGAKLIGQRVDRAFEQAAQLAVPGHALGIEVS